MNIKSAVSFEGTTQKEEDDVQFGVTQMGIVLATLGYLFELDRKDKKKYLHPTLTYAAHSTIILENCFEHYVTELYPNLTANLEKKHKKKVRFIYFYPATYQRPRLESS